MNYNHEEKEIHKACGFTDEQVGEVFEKANSVTKVAQEKESSLSEIVEGYENRLSRGELAFLLVTTQSELAQFRQVFSQFSKGVPQEVEEK